MKKLLLLSPMLILMACGGSTKNNEANDQEKSEDTPKENRIETNDDLVDISAIIKGDWTGDFGGNKLTIVIERVEGKDIQGYNIVKGNKRTIAGSYERDGNSVKVELKEPGDHKWDGVFYSEFVLDDIALKGTWKSNNGKLTTPFDLHRSTEGVDMRIVGKYIIEAIPYTKITMKADRTCSLNELDMETMGEEDANEDISLQGSWHSEGDKVIIEWWGSYFGEKNPTIQ